MTSVLKSASDTTTAVFTTVGTAANQITNMVNTTGQALDMLSSFVTTAREKQIARTEVDLEEFYTELVEESTDRIATRQLELTRKLNADPDYKKLFTENHSRMEALVKSIKDRKNA